MYIDVSFPRPSSRSRLGILVTWLPIDSVLLTEPSHGRTNGIVLKKIDCIPHIVIRGFDCKCLIPF